MHRLRDDETAINHSKYDAYGMHVSMPFPVADAFGYNGRWGYYTDDETGLVLCTYRYYDVATGRWLTRDPIGYSGGINVYGYCGGRPIGSSDPQGTLSPGAIWLAAGEFLFGAPPKPPGVDVGRNISEAEEKYNEWKEMVEVTSSMGDMGGGVPPMPPPHKTTVGAWLTDKVREGGEWDYKLRGKGLQYEPFGNWHYGVVGCAAGFSDFMLLSAAGVVQRLRGTTGSGVPFLVPPYGDHDRDQEQIKRGIAWYRWFHGAR